jgi:hypothetical protein
MLKSVREKLVGLTQFGDLCAFPTAVKPPESKGRRRPLWWADRMLSRSLSITSLYFHSLSLSISLSLAPLSLSLSLSLCHFLILFPSVSLSCSLHQLIVLFCSLFLLLSLFLPLASSTTAKPKPTLHG